MQHLEEGVLHAMLDGEIPSSELAQIERHLAQCADCQARMAEARQLRDEAFDLVETVQVPELAVGTSGAIPMFAPARQASAAPAAYSPPPVPVSADSKVVPLDSRRRRRWITGLAWAATLIIAVGLGYAGGSSRALRSAPILSQDKLSPAPEAKQEEFRAQADSNGAGAQEPAPSAPLAAAESDRPRPARKANAKPADSKATADVEREKAATSSSVSAREPTPVGDSAASRLDAKDQLAKENRRDEAAPRPAAAPPPSTEGQAAAGLRQTRQLGLARKTLRDDGKVVNEAGATGRASTSGARPVSMLEATQALGGTIRLIDGLLPEGFEIQGDTVRVLYRVRWGSLVLEERRTETGLHFALIPPSGSPADSIAAWRARIGK